MAWFKVDDGFHSSRKVMMIPRHHRLHASGLWVTAGSWSAQEELDGFVPEYMLDEWGATDEVVDALVKAGMWEHSDDGVQFVNWAEYQPTKSDLDEKRAKDRERKAAWREAKETQRRLREVSRRDTGGTPGGVQAESALSRPDPTRPDPTPIYTAQALESFFDDAYASWPKKVERKKSFEKFVQACKKRVPQDLADDIKRFGAAYSATTERQFVPALNVWLNGERWTDDLPVGKDAPQSERSDAWMNPANLPTPKWMQG